MRFVVIALVLVLDLAVARVAAADAIADCPARASIAPSTKVAAVLDTTYELANTDVRVCVDKAVYPYYGAGRGHRLLACFTIAAGKASTRRCGDANRVYADFKGYRIHVMLRKPRFTQSCDVWLMIEPTPPATPGRT